MTPSAAVAAPIPLASDPRHETVRRLWTHPAVAHAHRKWGEALTAWVPRATSILLDRAQLAPGQHVLDLGGGHGEPSIAEARRVGTSGRVVSTDLSLDILCLGLKRALHENLPQFEIEAADAHRLPFPPATFDRVTSRFGLSFFAEPATALREARRVLRPGGRIVSATWADPGQSLGQLALGPLLRRIRASRRVDEPGPFRFAVPGSTARAFSEAGFVEAAEETFDVELAFHGSPAEYWEFLTDTAPYVQQLVAQLPHRDQDEAVDEILAGLGGGFDGHEVRLSGQIHVATGGR